MILIDADVLLIRYRYVRDVRTVVNAEFLARVRAGDVAAGILQHTLLEVAANLSFNTSPADVPRLFTSIPFDCRLTVVPPPDPAANYAGVTEVAVRGRISRQMGLGDAVAAAQTASFRPTANGFVSWNARHFVGKTPVPVLTPADWLVANPRP